MKLHGTAKTIMMSILLITIQNTIILIEFQEMLWPHKELSVEFINSKTKLMETVGTKDLIAFPIPTRLF